MRLFLVGFSFFLSCTSVTENEVTPREQPSTKIIPSTNSSSKSAPTVTSQPNTQPSLFIHEVTTAARWKGSIAGAVNLQHPIAIKAGLKDARIPVLLPVHLLIHPKHGMYMIDSGITKKSPNGFMTVVDPVVTILARHTEPLVGVFLTHSHFDHVMGLSEMPKETILYMGPGEKVKTTLTIKHWDFTKATTLGGMPAIDVFGDGSLWALWVPGHTQGSTAYLAYTTEGPLLFIGDTAHIIWNWENGVGNGRNSANQTKNQKSLELLKAFVKEHPEIKVYTGHEIDGEGTGVDEVIKPAQ